MRDRGKPLGVAASLVLNPGLVELGAIYLPRGLLARRAGCKRGSIRADSARQLWRKFLVECEIWYPDRVFR